MSIDRRQFLGLAGMAAVAVVLGGCGRSTGTTLPPEISERWASAPPRLVVGVDAKRGHFVDADGLPVLVLADTVWTMPGVYGQDEAETYFTTRRAQGFNAVQTSSLPFHVDGKHRVDGCVDGQMPFVEADITRWDEVYWQRLDALLDSAAAHGFTVLLGVMGPLLSYGIGTEEQCREFGRLLGARYRDRPGILWLFGVDYGRNDWDRLDVHLLAALDGLRDAGAGQPATVQFHNDASLSADNARWHGRTQVEAAYSYAPTYEVVRRGYQLGTGPVAMVEANFEDENNTGGPRTTDESIRRQVLWTYTSGGTYAAYGRRDVWQSVGDYLGDLESTAVAQLGLVRQRLESLDWVSLEPDLTGAVLVDGAGQDVQHGSQIDGTADVLESDLATCAAAQDGSTAVVYVPRARPVRLSPGFAAGSASWWDPTTGQDHPAEVADGWFTPPSGRRADSSSDWLLVVEA